MKIKIDTLIYHSVYLLTFVSLFMLNNDRTSSNEDILNLILSFFTIVFVFILGVLVFFNILKIERKLTIYIALCLFCGFLVVFIRSYIIVHWIYLLISLYIVNSKEQLNASILKVTVYLAFSSVLFQLSVFRFFDGRPVLSYIDPNYSSYYIFCLFLFCWFSGFRKIALCLIFCGFMTLSRTYILAVISFTMVYKIRYLKNFFSRFNFSVLLILGHLFLFVISLIYIAKYTENTIDSTDMKEKNVTQLMDRSNMDRFTANILFIDDFSNDMKKYFWGIDLEIYTKNVFRNSPHNSLLQLVLNYGLFFTTFYFIVFSFILNKYHTSFNFTAAYIALLVYFLLLGGGIYGIQTIWLSFIYKSSILNCLSKKNNRE